MLLYPKVIVLCTNANGAAEFHSCTPEVTADQLRAGEHYALAKENARFNGFTEPMIAFDAEDPAAKQLESLAGYVRHTPPSLPGRQSAVSQRGAPPGQFPTFRSRISLPPPARSLRRHRRGCKSSRARSGASIRHSRTRRAVPRTSSGPESSPPMSSRSTTIRWSLSVTGASGSVLGCGLRCPQKRNPPAVELQPPRSSIPPTSAGFFIPRSSGGGSL